jgi:hypothetical protein
LNLLSRIILTLAAVALFCAPGCRSATIGTSDILDTETNRVVWEVVMRYRDAIEARDVDAVGAMVSRRYYENAGTTDSDADDYGYESLLMEVLPSLRDNVKTVQYRILMQDIAIDGDRAWADYEYYCNYRYVEGGREGWRQLNDFNRLELVWEDGTWKIVAGL